LCFGIEDVDEKEIVQREERCMYLYEANIRTALCFDRYICVERKTFSFTC